VRAAHDPGHRRDRNSLMLADEVSYFIRGFIIQPSVSFSSVPFPHDGFSAFVFDDPDRDL
jgi:hypothetical protein